MKILLYNVSYSRPALPYDKLGCTQQEALDHLRQTLAAPRYCLMDRTNNLVPVLRSNIPLTFGSSSSTFADLVQERVEEIRNLNKPVRVFWSGGGASTLIAMEFMNVLPPDQLEIVCSWNSLTDNPVQSIKDYSNKTILIGRAWELELAKTDKVNVTGIGNHYFSAPNSMPSVLESDMGAKPWTELQGQEQFRIEMLHSVLWSMPVSIQNTRQMLWALSILWLENHYRYAPSFNIRASDAVHDNICHFFLTQDFLNFGLSNFGLIDERNRAINDRLAAEYGISDMAIRPRRVEFVFPFRNTDFLLYEDWSYQSLEDFMQNGIRS